MKTTRLALCYTLPVSAVLALVAPAFAGNAADEAAAEVLFADGQKLVEAGNFAAACPKFEESQRLDAGAGTLLNLGNCYEKIGKLASAFGSYKEAEATARNANDTKRQAEAARRAEALALKLPTLALVVPPAARAPGFEIKRNGVLVGEGQWGSGVPVDPGHNTIEASAPGYKSWSTIVRIEATGSAVQIEIPPLEKLPMDAGATSGGSAQRSVGYAAIGVGGAGLLVGAIALGLDASKNSALAKQCSMGHCATSAQSDINVYHTLGALSSTSLIVGGALAAAGVFLVLVAPSKKPASVSPIVGLGYAGLSGKF
jgi:tetratricopeptide (TPR) repeat protein